MYFARVLSNSFSWFTTLCLGSWRNRLLHHFHVDTLDFVVPDTVGFRVGKGAVSYAVLQIFYGSTNLSLIIKTTHLKRGVRKILLVFKCTQCVYTLKLFRELTTNLRAVDAGYFVIGATTNEIDLPPGNPWIESK